MKTKIIVLLAIASIGLSGFVAYKKQTGEQTEEYAIVRYQEMGKRSIIAIYYNDKVVDRSDAYQMKGVMQGPNLDIVVPVLNDLNKEVFSLISASTSVGMAGGNGGFNGIYFVFKRSKN